MGLLVISKNVVGFAILVGILFIIIGGIVKGFKDDEEHKRKMKIKTEKRKRGW